MLKTRITALLILLLGAGIGFFVYKSEIAKMAVAKDATPKGFLATHPFKLGLDLSGGTHLVYRADVSEIDATEIGDSMSSLRDVIERRINIFGVSEPSIQVQDGGFSNQGEQRLIVDLPGVTDVSSAIAMIGETPMLDFRTENPIKDAPVEATVGKDGNVVFDPYASQYIKTELTGRYLDKAILEFDQTTGEAIVALQFDEEGSALFEKITKENVGKSVAIFLDGAPISIPTVNEAISGGKAQISGNFKATEAKLLVGRLNSGALPVAIELISTQTIGPSLGTAATAAGVKAALIGFLAIALFLIIWYRLPGLIATVALSIYVVAMLAIFKLVPVTLTAAGIAGFIISLGIAVDANVLIFERIKEELRGGSTVGDSMHHGFKRAWLSVRDSNISSIITAIILYWFGTTLIKGFALVFLIGVLVSLISAISITRIFLYTLNIKKTNGFTNFLFGSGLSSAKSQK
ncbi:MAG: Preprotein translocase subunit SecD [Candidatus Nomurabacteria bacterium GW2011_GWF2_35_66]|uniref:Protein translocase subunit SecD n=1 Tax=Candidatus Nomurabacteria bacterium GW2011_GWE1_35_16 TaxID=1618761 RepID=A0A0G0BB79_9BACT|nr:MAG: Preprotein translocase subunit SecD [Candidatus Nomurabacteria bacterium GW2011_GWF1_34_20]KKP63521.1 MAG: Preprotein translocase subunit SecD [Candidatus Nomurabacteria bacterium GW2011_GWE2_34_25]KKP66713.1 MAG: Preprotein translocase subunit SecD [Candidatus Nomurabacteria bacterium GW2011_GWE1_35_16]KKP83813.1 MAG: Preprotein translocase subunit SecD [Candidatus Nomurabacteria bacterium GW2011_GWF2_35_66]HAE36397.1 protein translocase subunit SecD [Candidatus Nomurabacteria bacteriu